MALNKQQAAVRREQRKEGVREGDCQTAFHKLVHVATSCRASRGLSWWQLLALRCGSGNDGRASQLYAGDRGDQERPGFTGGFYKKKKKKENSKPLSPHQFKCREKKKKLSEYPPPQLSRWNVFLWEWDKCVCRDSQEVKPRLFKRSSLAVPALVAANEKGVSSRHLGIMQLPPEKVVNFVKCQNINPRAV